NNSDTESTYVGGVDLITSKTTTATSVTPGGSIQYVIGYGNQGYLTAHGVTLFDTIPANTTFDASQNNNAFHWTKLDGSALQGGEPAGTQIKFVLGDLTVNQTGNVVLGLHVLRSVAAGADTLDNTVTIDDDHASGADLHPNDNTAM